MRRHVVEIVAFVVALAFGGWLGWRRLHPEERACAKVAKLCKSESDDACRGLLSDERTRLGGSRARAEAQCALDADDCKQALDCFYRAGKKR